jgi:hypothetical protein
LEDAAPTLPPSEMSLGCRATVLGLPAPPRVPSKAAAAAAAAACMAPVASAGTRGGRAPPPPALVRLRALAACSPPPAPPARPLPPPLPAAAFDATQDGRCDSRMRSGLACRRDETEPPPSAAEDIARPSIELAPALAPGASMAALEPVAPVSTGEEVVECSAEPDDEATPGACKLPPALRLGRGAARSWATSASMCACAWGCEPLGGEVLLPEGRGCDDDPERASSLAIRPPTARPPAGTDAAAAAAEAGRDACAASASVNVSGP